MAHQHMKDQTTEVAYWTWITDNKMDKASDVTSRLFSYNKNNNSRKIQLTVEITKQHKNNINTVIRQDRAEYSMHFGQ